MSENRIALIAPAKVNLLLSVGARRPDGYHDVVTILQALDARLADTVEIEAAPSLSVSCVPDIGVPSGENLVYRALVRLGELAGKPPDLTVVVRKSIPAGGGLGGASSDAAAALVGACRLWGLDAHSPEVTGLAASLGADVPFFISGGTALYSGKGEVLVRRLETPPLEMVVINPGVPVSTPAAYAAFDRLIGAKASDPAEMLDALAKGDPAGIAACLGNNMSEAAVDLAPEVGDALRFLSQSEGILGCLVSGSGSSVFGICENECSAAQVAAAASMRDGWRGYATSAFAGGITDAGT